MLGALALAVCESILQATQQQADGLGGSEPAALVTLAHYPGQSVGHLARTLGLTHSGAVRLADRLETAGLVSRTCPGPGRILALYLTDPGRVAASRVLARRQAAVGQLLRGLDPGEVIALDRLAGRLLAAMTTDRASAHRLCRLCDEPLCAAGVGCPVDQAADG